MQMNWETVVLYYCTKNQSTVKKMGIRLIIKKAKLMITGTAISRRINSSPGLVTVLNIDSLQICWSRSNAEVAEQGNLI